VYENLFEGVHHIPSSIHIKSREFGVGDGERRFKSDGLDSFRTYGTVGMLGFRENIPRFGSGVGFCLN
jgi:hypothetical protein